MRNITESDTEEEWIELENFEEDSEDNFKYEELKKQIRRKYRAIEKQTMRKYLKGKDSDYMIIINSKIYGNLEGKIRKRRRKSSEFSDSGANVI